MDASPLPLTVGSTGAPIQDLHRRLVDAGFSVADDGQSFGPRTEAAVKALQTDRGVEADGVVDERTWIALVEAGYRLGDRPLYRQSPMLRGSDVTTLQIQLGTLGFDAGWVDGILGPDTERAIRDFQRNVALPIDGIAGPRTIAELHRFGGRQSERAVASVRERENLRSAAPQLAGRQVVIGECGESPALVDAIGRALRRHQAQVLTLHEPDLSVQAAAANAFDGSVYLGLRVHAEALCTATYFSTEGFTSDGGRALALQAEEFLPRVLALEEAQIAGGRLPILRETRMPAIWCDIGPASRVVRRTAALADTIVTMLTAWCENPLGPDDDA